MSDLKIWYVDPRPHSSMYKKAIERHTAWSAKPPRNNSYQINTIEVVEKSAYDQVKQELDQLKLERSKVAHEKVECADCGSLLARW